MAGDQEGDNRGLIRKHVGWWIGVIAGLAGIVGLIFTITTREQFTVKEWRQQADAACIAVKSPLNAKWAKATTALYTLETGGYKPADYQTAARLMARTPTAGPIDQPLPEADLLPVANDVWPPGSTSAQGFC
ncbi:hypothetical protein ACFVJ8_27865 [Streptomyces yangpuensis]|uniref:hypothetical protein n=1 Tax=Streptomyces yangpuensis TaxID=1648182 RepID=UPI0036456120